ncbi:hypothetical protein [Planococcus wigleyi]|uniref:Uncharacterized protein n=1 Tax=Planococcus wigleyi TaxID=2762216 RepID=A0ABR8WBU3_9BACL|nr:hypothetical protein [Planococcus wigleyi]MBD8014489.1 hypothetical protein [Planococcus wigleyi]
MRDISKWTYKCNSEYLALEEWMLFAMGIGGYIRDYSKKNKSEIHIYLSLPNSLLFSYFIATGIFNEKMSEEVTDETILNYFKKLTHGDQIYYFDNEEWKRCSVINLIQGKTREDSWHLLIRNHKQIAHYIPLSQWKEKIIISGNRTSEIKNALVIKDFKRASTGNLQYVYPEKSLQSHELLNEVCVNIAGTKSEFLMYSNAISLKINQKEFTFADFLYDGSSSEFKNIKWISKVPVLEGEITMFLNASKGISDMHYYKKTSRIFLDDRHDNREKSELLRMSIEQELIQGNLEIITSFLIEELKKKSIKVPQGVEILAWK